MTMDLSRVFKQALGPASLTLLLGPFKNAYQDSQLELRIDAFYLGSLLALFIHAFDSCPYKCPRLTQTSNALY